MIPFVWFLNFFYKKYLIDIWNNKKMGMSMGIKKYPLPGGDGDGSKVVYPLGLGMGMGMDFYYGDGIMIPVPAPLPSLLRSRYRKLVSFPSWEGIPPRIP